MGDAIEITFDTSQESVRTRLLESWDAIDRCTVREQFGPPIPDGFREAFLALDLSKATRILEAFDDPYGDVFRGRLLSIECRFDESLPWFKRAMERLVHDKPPPTPYRALATLAISGCFAADVLRMQGTATSRPLAVADRLLQSDALARHRAYSRRAECYFAETIGDFAEADRCATRIAELLPDWELQATALAARASYALVRGDEAQALEHAEAAEIAAAGCSGYGVVFAAHRLAAFFTILGDLKTARRWVGLLESSGCHEDGIRAFRDRIALIVNVYEQRGVLLCS